MQFIGYKGITGIEYPDGSVTPNILQNELNEIGYDTSNLKSLMLLIMVFHKDRNRIIFIGYRKGLKSTKVSGTN